MRRANENDGVFRNPMANATPEGIHFAYHNCRFEADVLSAERNPKIMAEHNMNTPLLSGSSPSPVVMSQSIDITPHDCKKALTEKPRKAKPHICCRCRE
jgi:hypothetical protein